MKTCTKCSTTRPAQAFRAGRGACRDCEKAARLTPEARAMRAENQRRYRKAHADRCRARQMAARAIRAGRLTLGPCGVCGTTQDVQAHHDDYSKPLEVRPLCRGHHAAWHASNSPLRLGGGE